MLKTCRFLAEAQLFWQCAGARCQLPSPQSSANADITLTILLAPDMLSSCSSTGLGLGRGTRGMMNGDAERLSEEAWRSRCGGRSRAVTNDAVEQPGSRRRAVADEVKRWVASNGRNDEESSVVDDGWRWLHDANSLCRSPRPSIHSACTPWARRATYSGVLPAAELYQNAAPSPCGISTTPRLTSTSTSFSSSITHLISFQPLVWAHNVGDSDGAVVASGGYVGASALPVHYTSTSWR